MSKKINIVEAIELAAWPEKKLNDFLVITLRIIPSNSAPGNASIFSFTF